MTVLTSLQQGFPGTQQSVAMVISAVREQDVAKRQRPCYTVPVLPIGNKNRLPSGNREEMLLQRTAPAIWLPPYVAFYCDAFDESIGGIVDLAMILFLAGEPTERLVSVIRPEHAVSSTALELLKLSRGRIDRSPSIGALVPRIRAFAGDLPIATHDVAGSGNLLSLLPDSTRISVKAIAQRAWPLEKDLRLESLADAIRLRHWALDEIPIDRAETLALTVGLVLREALSALNSLDADLVVPSMSDWRRVSRWN